MATTSEYGARYPYLINASRLAEDVMHNARLAAITISRIAIPLRLKPGNSVLDVGCCLGTTGHFLSKGGIKAYGLDLNINAIEEGHRIWSNDKKNYTFVANSQAIPFPDASFTSVISQDVLEHVSDPDTLDIVFNEMCRVVKGKRMFHKITTLEDTKNIHADSTHHLKWTEDQWQTWFLDKGWQTISSPTRHFPGRGISYGNFLLQKI